MSAGVLEHGLALALSLGYTLLAATAGYCWSWRLDPEAPRHLRLGGALVLALWFALASFSFLGPLGGFSRLGLAALLLLLAGLGLRDTQTQLRDVLEADRQALRSLTLRATDPLLWIGVLVAGSAALRMARRLVMPPSGTDALTYHLFRAGRFVQTGGFAVEATADAGGYYAYYPPLGDALWGLAMLPGHSDAYLGLVNAATWALLIPATYAAAREYGAPARVSLWAGLALAATPAVLSWSSTAYVDGFLLLFVTSGVAWLPRALSTGRIGSLIITAAAFALAAGTKTTGVVPAALAAMALGLTCLLRTAPGKAIAGTAGIALAFSLALPGYLRAYTDHGNPLYPFELKVLGKTIWSGNPENMLLHRGALFSPEQVHFDVGTFIQKLFWPNFGPGVQHLNFGPAAVFVLALALAGSRWLRESKTRIPALILVGVLGVFALKLSSADTLVLRTSSAAAIGRTLTIPFMILVLAASRGPKGPASVIFGLVALCGAWLSWPRSLGAIDLHALKASLPAILSALALAGIAWRLRGRRGQVLVGGIAVVVLLVGAASQRATLRRPYYEALHANEINDPHPVDPKATAAYPIWDWLEAQPKSLRIAFTAGWDGRGHHWYRSPLLGSRLQHEVFYISPTPDGTLVDYRDKAAMEHAADRDAWLASLSRTGIELVMLCVPKAPEHRWVMEMPDRFRLLARGVDNYCLAFEFVDPNRAAK